MKGTREQVETLRRDIVNFLTEELYLDLSPGNTPITHLPTHKAQFLGVYFFTQRINQRMPILSINVKGGKVPSSLNERRIVFHMPTANLITQMKEKGFIKEKEVNQGSTLVPNAKTAWIYLDHSSIINRYNGVINGLYNYYRFTDNSDELRFIINFYLKHSCAKTLARKYNLRSRAKAFKKFGSNLASPKQDKSKIISI